MNEVEELKKIINQMNAIALHQTNRVDFGQPHDSIFPTHVHPLTCGNDSNHTPLYPWCDDGRVKLICRDCSYTQNNAGMFSRG